MNQRHNRRIFLSLILALSIGGMAEAIAQNPSRRNPAITVDGQPLPRGIAVGSQPSIEVTPVSLKFSATCAGDSASLNLTIRNIGNEALRVMGSSSETDNPLFVFTLKKDVDVAPGDSILVPVLFVPMTEGPQNGALFINNSDNSNPSVKVELSGSGAFPGISGGPTVRFADAAIGESSIADYSITSIPPCPLRIDSVRITGADSRDFSVIAGLPTLPFTISPGATQSVSIRFERNSNGARSANLEIYSNDPAVPLLRVTLEVDAPVLSVEPSRIFFDDIECGEAATRQVIVRNVGNSDLILESVSLINDNFTLLNAPTPNTNINPGDSVNFAVEFRTAAEVFRSDSLVIASNDAGSPALINITGRSIDGTPPVISCPGPITAVSGANDSALVDVTITASDQCDPAPEITCAIPGTPPITFPAYFPIGTSTVACVASDSAKNTARCEFDVTVIAQPCSIAIVTPAEGAIFCADSVLVQVAILDSGRAGIVSSACSINAVNATLAGDTFSALVPLFLGINPIIAECAFLDANGAGSFCRDTVTVTQQAVVRDVVLNEILYDPNYDDLGQEKIEIKNIGDSRRSLDGFALWIDHGGANTFWSFPRGTSIASKKLLVIHWLTEGSNDAGNLFTGLPTDSGDPSDSKDGFWGDNSGAVEALLMGGKRNDTPLGIALLERISPGEVGSTHDACKMVDFLQICGSTPSDSLAAAAKLWLSGEYVQCAHEGSSVGLSEDPKEDLTTPDDFFEGDPTPGMEADPDRLTGGSHLLISELCVRPAFAEFIEIYNPTAETVFLSSYYLTDNSNGLDNAYTLLTLGVDSMQVADGDFFVQFPSSATIAPGEYQTIAFDNAAFSSRYNTSANYEIAGSDAGVLDMIVISNGSTPRLADGNEMLMLLQWDGTSDLVRDVDYIVWGEQPGGSLLMQPEARGAAKLGQATGDNAIQSAPLEEAVDKTGLGRDGNGDDIRTYYNVDTPLLEQRPVATGGHGLLRSWQRRIGSRTADAIESGERKTGGNGITGHDETSERLSVTFVDKTPTPGEKLNELDLVVTDYFSLDIVPNGESEGSINPGETVAIHFQVANLGANSTGELIGFLRTDNPFVESIDDSISMYPSIAPGDSAFPVDPFVFTTKALTLPDTIFFELELIEKETPNPLSKSSTANVASVSSITIPVYVLTNNAFVKVIAEVAPRIDFATGTRTLVLTHKMKNTLMPGTGAVVAYDIQTQIISFSAGEVTPVSRNYGELAPSVATFENSTYSFAFAIPDSITGDEEPEVIIEVSWDEDRDDNQKSRISENISWPSPPAYTVSGAITSHGMGEPVANAHVRIERGPFTLTQSTDSDGHYSFSVPAPGQYRVSVALNDIPQGAISNADTLSAQYLIQSNCDTLPGTDIFAIIAADVDGNGCIEPSDVNAIRARINAPCNKFAIGKDWIFVNATVAEADIALADVPEDYNIGLRHFDLNNVDFTAVLFGDVDGSANFATSVLEDNSSCNRYSISGRITYFNPSQTAINGAIVKLGGGSVMTTMSTTTGDYTFNGLLEKLRYDARVAQIGGIPNGTISTSDLEAFNGILMNLPCPLDQYACRAADINLDGQVSAADTSGLATYLLTGENPPGMHFGEWIFVPHEVTDLFLNGNVTDVDFQTAILGNVDVEWPVTGEGDGTKQFSKPGLSIPDEFSLSNNYPNPFNPATAIELALPQQVLVRLHVYNIAGHRVRTILDEVRNAGYHKIKWDGRDDNNHTLPSGVYVMRVQAGGFAKTLKTMMIK